MVRALSYADAVKLLGGDGKAVAALDTLAGGALLVASTFGGNFILSLFDAKGELAKVSGALIRGLRERVSGLGRFDRTQRLEAAHVVIALTAYFEALAAADLPDLGLRRADQVAIAAGGAPSSGRLRSLTREFLHLDVPSISPHRTYDTSIKRLRDYYSALSQSLVEFAVGLAVWEALDETDQERLSRTLREDVPPEATRRYQELLLRLAGDFPEVSFWVNLNDRRAMHAEIRAGLAELEQTLTELTTGSLPDDRREALARRYRAELRRGVVRTGTVPDELRIPSLEDAYIDHRFRVCGLGRSARPDREDWWQGLPIRDDLYAYLLGHLTSPEAVRRPLLVLGQPGSGKSVLTTILAARLPASDFLVVRVALRDTPADSDLQGQIEYAIRDATGETLSWPSLARTAGDALPVVVLDGFDELLQATGVSQSDYLEQVVRFQEREADQGRPVVVLVTSRTAVADRVRVPAEGAIAVRLEPFDKAQVRHWLDVWNRANAAYLAGRGLRPLSAQTALVHPELAEQPLLLMMLALYDADGNGLQREGDDLDLAGLYERLLTSFAEREVAKSRARLDDREFRRAVEQDLLRLSVAAFAMFNRGRQWVTEDELDTDLTALLHDRVASTGMHAPLSAAQTVLGRFFFVHQAHAVRDQTRLTTCEFLHATFGEYLVARLVARELEELAGEAERNARRARRTAPDDTFLYALLSFVPLSIRMATTNFLESMLGGREDQATLRDVLLDLFRTAMEPRSADPSYAPSPLSVPARHAAYSANLLLLIVAACEMVPAGDLFPGSADVVADWRRHALLWRSQLTTEGFFSLAGELGVWRSWDPAGRRDIHIRSGWHNFPPADLNWTYNEQATGPGISSIKDNIVLETAFTCSRLGDTLTNAIHSWEEMIDAIFIPNDSSLGASPIKLLADLMLAATDPRLPAEELTSYYDICLDAVEAGQWGSMHYIAMIYRQLRVDQHRVSTDWLSATVERIGQYASSHPEALRLFPNLKHLIPEKAY
ncbi:AAA family ATPase [Actinoallomurus sp. NBC_01490]|uniref:NACHT domain-containing protein n=1 Tax=Actinoallomurus sp. NBC_01490 TaxID=2903557 RepID=UPI002E3300AC|nr:AAA family ATPase [Actinoallomurus sp. NBC_01490]